MNEKFEDWWEKEGSYVCSEIIFSHDVAKYAFNSATEAEKGWQACAEQKDVVIANQAEELKALRGFANGLFKDVHESMGIDGCDLLDLGLKHGLLQSENPSAPCGGYCNCALECDSSEFKDGLVECIRKTKLLTGEKD